MAKVSKRLAKCLGRVSREVEMLPDNTDIITVAETRSLMTDSQCLREGKAGVHCYDYDVGNSGESSR